MLTLGTRIDRFIVQSPLGMGGMAYVYKVVDLRSKSYGALKLPNLSVRQDAHGVQRLIERFDREIECHGRLIHPRIVRVLHDGELSPQLVRELFPAQNGAGLRVPYFVMELVDGQSLAQRFETAAGHPPPLAELLTYIDHVAEGLDYAHARKIFHRDVTPRNILLSSDRAAKIADFGLVKVTDVTGPLSWGTRQYMAPELYQPNLWPVGRWTDLYSLAAVATELLTGEVRRVEESGGQPDAPLRPTYRQRPEVERRVFEVLIRAMSAHPPARHESAGAFARDLRAAFAPSSRLHLHGLTTVPVRGAARSRPAQPAGRGTPLKVAPAPPVVPSPGRRVRQGPGSPPGRSRGRSGWPVSPYLLVLLFGLVGLGLGWYIDRTVLPVDPSGPAASATPAEQPTGLSGVLSQVARPQTGPTPWPTLELPAQRPFPQAEANELLGGAGNVGVVMIDLESGEQIFGFNLDRAEHPLGLSKLPIAMVAYRLAAAGEISLDERVELREEDRAEGTGSLADAPPGGTFSVRELADRMLAEADLSASNMLLRRVGRPAIAALLAEAGASDSVVERRFGHPAEDTTARQNQTTPDNIARLLELLWRERGGAYGELLTAMGRSEAAERRMADLEPGAEVYYLGGYDPSERGPASEYAAAIVVPPGGRPYALVVMAAGRPTSELREVIGAVWRMAYESQRR